MTEQYRQLMKDRSRIRLVDASDIDVKVMGEFDMGKGGEGPDGHRPGEQKDDNAYEDG